MQLSAQLSKVKSVFETGSFFNVRIARLIREGRVAGPTKFQNPCFSFDNLVSALKSQLADGFITQSMMNELTTGGTAASLRQAFQYSIRSTDAGRDTLS